LICIMIQVFSDLRIRANRVCNRMNHRPSKSCKLSWNKGPEIEKGSLNLIGAKDSETCNMDEKVLRMNHVVRRGVGMLFGFLDGVLDGILKQSRIRLEV
jgi:hypothetical protein